MAVDCGMAIGFDPGSLIVALFTQNSRLGIASVSIFFILGFILLMHVDEERAEEEIRDVLNGAQAS